MKFLLDGSKFKHIKKIFCVFYSSITYHSTFVVDNVFEETDKFNKIVLPEKSCKPVKFLPFVRAQFEGKDGALKKNVT